MIILRIPTSSRSCFVDITAEIESAVTQSGITEGTCVVCVPHTTAGVTINENADPDVRRDIIDTLERLVPWTGNYRHSEGNAAAHVKASLMGSSATVPVEAGHLRLGTWQGIFLCEFDGPRRREIWVTITKS
jgi:secondary thiamine-phosphate synthase enzyme